MSANIITHSFNELGHEVIDWYNGTDSTQARANFIEQATDVQFIGAISLVAAAIFAAISLVSSVWFVVPLSFIPLIAGIEIIRIGENAKDLVSNSLNRVFLSYNQEEFISNIADGTVLMGCFLNCFPEMVDDLYGGYCEVTRLS